MIHYNAKYTKFLAIGITLSFLLIHILIYFNPYLAEQIIYHLSISSSPDLINIILLPIKGITSTFIHIALDHFLFNLLALITFGAVVEHIVGPKEFLKIYFGSAILGAILFFIVSLMYGNLNEHAIGASAAIAGLMGFLCVVEPNTIVFFIIFPMNIVLATALFIILSIVFIISMGPGAFNIAHAAHLGGIIYGILYGLKYLKKHKYSFLE